MHVMRKYNAKPQRICIFFFFNSNNFETFFRHSVSSPSYLMSGEPCNICSLVMFLKTEWRVVSSNFSSVLRFSTVGTLKSRAVATTSIVKKKNLRQKRYYNSITDYSEFSTARGNYFILFFFSKIIIFNVHLTQLKLRRS